MVTLTVTKRRQVTLQESVLHHLGVKPGDKLELDLLPSGQVVLRRLRPTGAIDDFIGMLSGKSEKPLTIDEMNQIAATGWAGRK